MFTWCRVKMNNFCCLNHDATSCAHKILKKCRNMSKIASMVKNCVETKSLSPKDSFPDINANWNMQ